MMPIHPTLRRAACGALLLGLLCAHPAVALVCGDGILDPFETCDDGNLVPGDGCTPLCQLENLPPVCTGASASVTDLWPPNHKLATVLVTGVVDPDDDPVAIVVSAIAQDEPVDGSGDGDTCPDAAGVGTDAAQVRVERSGEGDGRVYHIAFVADDGRGGTCIGSVTTCVPHDRGQGSVCADGGPLFDSIGVDPATCGGCDLGECVPPDDELDACAADLPRGIERRTARARALLARAVDVGPGPRATRLARKATRVLARAAERARAALEGHCGDTVGALLDAAGQCAECPEHPGD